MKLLCFLYNLAAVSTFTACKGVSDVFENDSMKETVDGRIAGGRVVDSIKEFPFQVQILLYSSVFCSGAIISENYILTAAQCVSEEFEPEGIKGLEVKAGNLVRGEGTVIPIAEVVKHPEYDHPNLDIAYMRTVSPIVFTEEIQPGKLSYDRFLPYKVTVSGWGLPRRRYNKLREVELDSVDLVRCYAGYHSALELTSNMGCAGNLLEMDEGACRWDEGDPVTRNSRLYGLVSVTEGCGPGMAPTVFTLLQAEAVREFIINGTGVRYHQYPDPY